MVAANARQFHAARTYVTPITYTFTNTERLISASTLLKELSKKHADVELLIFKLNTNADYYGRNQKRRHQTGSAGPI
jgi:hypothetical protein